MKIDINEAHELYKTITENQAIWLTNKGIPRKLVVVHNIDAVIVITVQMEVLTMKLDNISRFVRGTRKSERKKKKKKSTDWELKKKIGNFVLSLVST